MIHDNCNPGESRHGEISVQGKVIDPDGNQHTRADIDQNVYSPFFPSYLFHDNNLLFPGPYAL